MSDELEKIIELSDSLNIDELELLLQILSEEREVKLKLLNSIGASAIDLKKGNTKPLHKMKVNVKPFS